jgi:Cu/Ag efflux pump CusA
VEVRDVIAAVRGAADVSVDVSAGAMQVELAIDRTALPRYRLNIADVRAAVESGRWSAWSARAAQRAAAS